MSESEENETDVSPARANELVSAGAQVVDVRQTYEWEAGHIVDAAHIVLETLPSRAEEIDRERPVVFVCRSGSRSSFATSAFREAGFEAYNLAGGLLDWVADGQMLEPVGGEVAGPRFDAA